jgi:hypothetical protein
MSHGNEASTGTAQVRQLRIEGKLLDIRSQPAKHPLNGRLSWSALEWTRVE